MNLKHLHQIMSEKGYHYFDGKTNSTDDNIYLDFSTGHNGRGDWFEITIGPEHHNIMYRDKDGELVEHKNINDNEIFKIIKNK